MKKCRNPKPARQRITTTMDKLLYDQLIPTIEKDWGGPFSSWLDYIATCWMRDDCTNCPYEEQEGQEKAGIGKIQDK